MNKKYLGYAMLTLIVLFWLFMMTAQVGFWHTLEAAVAGLGVLLWGITALYFIFGK